MAQAGPAVSGKDHAGFSWRVGYASPDLVSLFLEQVKQKKVASSVKNGAVELARLVNEHVTTCPPAAGDGALDSDVLLVGYSQGAWVINYFLQQYQALSSLIEGGVILFGDPEYEGASVYAQRTGGPSGNGLARWADWLYSRPIDPYIPFAPATRQELRDFSLSYCLVRLGYFDPICHVGPEKSSLGVHLLYGEAGGPIDQAVNWVEKMHINGPQ